MGKKITCRECGAKISSSCNFCPLCGAKKSLYNSDANQAYFHPAPRITKNKKRKEKKSSFWRVLLVVVGIASLIWIIVAVAIISSYEREPSEKQKDTHEKIVEATPAQTMRPTPTPEPEYLIGDTQSLGDLEITVTDYEIDSSSDAGEGNEWLIVYLTVKNNGTSPTNFYSMALFGDNSSTLVVDGVYKYSMSIDYLSDLLDENIQPLASASGHVKFKVPSEVLQNKREFVFTVWDASLFADDGRVEWLLWRVSE